MIATSFDELMPEVEALPVIDIDGDELLAVFAEVMIEWGHHRTAHDLRYPTLAEARRAVAGRRTDRGWDTSPIPG